jgi:signal peptidase
LTILVVGIGTVFVLSALGTARFIPVLSNSMAPEMPKGSLAVVLPTPRPDINAGDIIVFTAPDGSHRRVIHRVNHLYGPDEATTIKNWTPDKLYLLTKGDNNPQKDPWLLTLSDPTLWKQTTVLPAAGWPAIWLADPTVRIAVFAAGGALVAAWAIHAVWRRDTEETAPAPGDNELPGTATEA